MTDPVILEGLRASKLAVELTEAQCRALADLLERRDLAPHEVLVAEGTTDPRMHLLVKGSAAAVVRGDGTTEETTLFTLGPGDTIGELSFLDDHVHRASIVSHGPSTVLSLERGRLESLLDRDPHLVYRVMRAIVRRVHEIQHRLSAQAHELANYVYKQGGRY